MNSSTKPDAVNAGCKLTCDFETLRKSPLFQGADSEVVRLFAYLAKHRHYRKGQGIIEAGGQADEAFYLLSGTAEVTVRHRNKDEILQRLAPPCLFGELALLARFQWFFTVRAMQQSEALVISRESFHKVMENFPRRRERLIERIIQLRVQRMADQTKFMLDTLGDPRLEGGGPHVPESQLLF